MADEETRSARQKAIAEKKRRLEEIKARRNAAGGATSAPFSGGVPSGGANLDEYIDELLKGSAPLPAAAAPAVEETKEVAPAAPVDEEKPAESSVKVETPPPTTTAPQPAIVASPAVEKFEVAIQCEEDDFPPPSLVDEDEPPEKDDEESTTEQEALARSLSRDSDAFQLTELPPVEMLTEEEKSKLIESQNFTRFISTASKRVERLLGANAATGEEGGLAGLLMNGWAGIDFVEDPATDETEESDTAKKSKSKNEESYQSGGFFAAKQSYEFPVWTKGRNITDLEWCPGHKEWILVSYNSRGERREGQPSTRHLSPHDPSSSFLSASSIPNEGVIAIYNLILPTRPEHIFCAGCPIVKTKFHPSEHPKLVLGGGTSGQLLVWDARVGKYPVQRSGTGHDVDLVGMEVLYDESGAGSKLITASSDGKINYWSVSNMRQPLESFTVNANLSCLDVMHGSKNEGVVCGDEKGGMHAVYSAAASSGAGSSSLKRVCRTMHGGGGFGVDPAAVEEDPLGDAEDNVGIGHFGMVTSVASRPIINNSNSPRLSSSEGIFKGFLKGVGGFVVTTGVDWSTKLWAPAYTDRPLMSFLSNSYDYMCDVQWSPVHPSIFATASSNGTLNLWNLATSLDQPISGSEGILIDDSPTSAGLNRLQWSADGRRMAVASGDQLHVLGVGDDLWKSKGDEESRILSNMISRGFIQEDLE